MRLWAGATLVLVLLTWLVVREAKLPLLAFGAENWQVPQATARVEVVRSVITGLVRYAALASGQDSALWRSDAVTISGTAPQAVGDAYRVRVNFGGEKEWETAVTVSGEADNAAAYLDFTRELLERARAVPRKKSIAAPHPSLLATLTFPRVEVLQHENARISRWLQEAPLDAEAHEEAALLLATLGWREASGLFRDPRELCVRAAAHLILAQTLRAGALTPCGAAAELMTGLVEKSSADHAQRLRQLAARAIDAPELNPWISTAELALGGDWHSVGTAGNPTLLEQIECFRAICRTAGTGPACEHLVQHEFEDVADWTRILMEHDFGGAEGRRFIKFGLPFEQEEAARVFPTLAGQNISSPAWAKVLNTEVDFEVAGATLRDSSVCVLDSGLWAQFLQRHLCHLICRTGDHLRATAAMPEFASAYFQSMAVIYRHLKLIPLAAVASGERPWLKTAAPAIATLVQQHPEWVSEGIWNRFLRQGPQEITRGLPTVAQWTGEDSR